MKVSIKPSIDEIDSLTLRYVSPDKENPIEVKISYDYEGSRKEEKVSIESFSDEGVVIRWKRNNVMRILYTNNVEIEDIGSLEKTLKNNK